MTLSADKQCALLNHAELDFALTCIKAGVPPMMVGPAGCGKTSIARQAAKTMGIDFYYTGAVESAFMLRGFRDAHGNVEETSFVKAYRNGGIFLFDEIDASDPSALVSINAALDNGVFDTPAGMVERHENFYFMGAANTWGNGATLEYMGRNNLDGSTLDRFVTIAMDYDEALERSLIEEKHPNQMAWAETVFAARATVREMDVKHIVSTRAHLHGARLLDVGADLQRVKESVLWRGLPKDTKVKLEHELSRKLAALRPRPQPVTAPSPSSGSAPRPVSSGDFVAGQLVEGKGIYLGRWQPKDRQGVLLDRNFRVFAAPTDLMDDVGRRICKTFVGAAEEVGKLRNWHGHNGIYLPNDSFLYSALNDGAAIGKWFIPPRELMDGSDADGNFERSLYLLGLQERGAFEDTFEKSWYWSCTQLKDAADFRWNIDFTTGRNEWSEASGETLNCRPVRVEEVEPSSNPRPVPVTIPSTPSQPEPQPVPVPSTPVASGLEPNSSGDYVAGQLVEGKGIYVGLWQPKDREGGSLDNTFHVFAAPTDMMDTSGNKTCHEFNDAAEEVGKLRNWHGHNGIYLPNDSALYKALLEGRAIGKWMIPPREILHGTDIIGRVVLQHNLFSLRDVGAFQGTYTCANNGSAEFPHHYWSCSTEKDKAHVTWAVRFNDGESYWLERDRSKLNCRPIRVEVAGPARPAVPAASNRNDPLIAWE